MGYVRLFHLCHAAGWLLLVAGLLLFAPVFFGMGTSPLGVTLLVLAGTGLLLARVPLTGRNWWQTTRRGLPATATVSSCTRRGRSEQGVRTGVNPDAVSGRPEIWCDLWVVVVPDDPAAAPFHAFVSQGLTPERLRNFGPGTLLPVVYDPRTGLVVITDAQASLGFGHRSIIMLGKARSLNRRQRRLERPDGAAPQNEDFGGDARGLGGLGTGGPALP